MPIPVNGTIGVAPCAAYGSGLRQEHHVERACHPLWPQSVAAPLVGRRLDLDGVVDVRLDDRGGLSRTVPKWRRMHRRTSVRAVIEVIPPYQRRIQPGTPSLGWQETLSPASAYAAERSVGGHRELPMAGHRSHRRPSPPTAIVPTITVREPAFSDAWCRDIRTRYSDVCPGRVDDRLGRRGARVQRRSWGLALVAASDSIAGLRRPAR